MEELIKISEHNGMQAVSARDLHSFLGSKKDFSSWIKDRIKKYDLTENQDYVLLPNLGEQTRGGHNKIEYALTIDCAKELSMVEGTEKGKQARRYFIACEKKLKDIAINGMPSGNSNEPLTVEGIKAKIAYAEWMFSSMNLDDESKLIIIKSMAGPLGIVVPNVKFKKGTKQQLSTELTDDFIYWADSYLESRMNTHINKTDMVNDWIKAFPQESKRSRLRRLINAYCLMKGYEFNPNELLQTETEALRKEIRGYKKGKDIYYWHIRKMELTEK